MSKITESARGEECQVRIPGYCNGDNDTVVFAHKNGGGMGMKSSDLHGAYCCSSCHDILDGRAKLYNFSPDKIRQYFYEGIFRTQLKLIEKDLVVI